MYKVVLWGLGQGYNVFVSNHGLKMVDVVAIVDIKRGGYVKSTDGIPVVTPDELVNEGLLYDYLVVTVLDDGVFDSIVKEATSMGIPREIILPSRIFQIPFFDFGDYVKIKNSNISILSDYCFAGYLYHKFGMRFTSPTINMFADNENYLQFIGDLNRYMNEPMIEVKDSFDDIYCNHTYLRGRLDDVEWVFNHDIYFSTAEERWRHGVERFNWENYIVIMTITSDDAAYKFDSLPIKHKIGFYWKNLNLPSVICMSEWENPEIRAMHNYSFSAFVNRVADEKSGVRAVNWMRALLHQDSFIRV